MPHHITISTISTHLEAERDLTVAVERHLRHLRRESGVGTVRNRVVLSDRRRQRGGARSAGREGCSETRLVVVDVTPPRHHSDDPPLHRRRITGVHRLIPSPAPPHVVCGDSAVERPADHAERGRRLAVARVVLGAVLVRAGQATGRAGAIASAKRREPLQPRPAAIGEAVGELHRETRTESQHTIRYDGGARARGGCGPLVSRWFDPSV